MSLRLCGVILLITSAINAQPAPKDVLGFTPGDDRKLASWAQIVDYFKRLDTTSDRVRFEEIGKTTLGATFVFATISTPENLKNLEKYKQINAKLADPRTIGARTLLSARGESRETALQLIKQGKTIVLITCGIHSTEVGSTLSSMLIAHKLATSDDPEIKKILENTIILLVPSLNPDGVDIVKNWYDKTLGTKFEGTEPPELYHKYVGHDNNRDWYAFTQVETQLTVDKIHNVWHPQIVHDIHQQGAFGARLFLPPYMPPVEPNVPKQIVEGYTELGNAMAADLRKKGFQGITTNTTYDAWTPARAYSHYHGGVRILSETASARLATPITVKFEDLRSSVGGLDAKKESPNFGPVWKGGEWKLRNITDYMTTAAFSLLNHSADNREKWLSRFYEIGKEAVRPRKSGELSAFLLPFDIRSYERRDANAYVPGPKENSKLDFISRRERLIDLLRRGGVEVDEPTSLKIGSKAYSPGTAIVRISQPYGLFAKALLETQVYPNWKDGDGNPVTPYDVTAHTLPLLMGVEVDEIRQEFTVGQTVSGRRPGYGQGCGHPPIYLTFRSKVPSMDEGWTRWLFSGPDNFATGCGEYEGITAEEIRDLNVRQANARNFGEKWATAIVFPDQSPNQILNGYAKGSMPDEYTGGVGKEGVENLRKFVEAGGTLVFLNRASNFAIEQFNLPVKDVTKGLARKDFFIPGSILRTELDTTHPIAKGMPAQSIAWFENSPVFEIIETQASSFRLPSLEKEGWPRFADGVVRSSFTEKLQFVKETTTPPAEAASTPPLKGGELKNFRIIARYPTDPKNILLSGWALGAEKIAGKAALVEFTVGKGKIVLFGFRPQYRGQSLATFPLLFNSISN